MSKVDLKIDWATHKAAKYAVEHWHYSKVLPAPPLIKIGVWENEKFIGVVLFSRGASNNLLKPFGLTQYEGCELTRIALREHENPVSKIVPICIKILKNNNPGLRLVVSFADPSQNHIGLIYQAMNWIYTGQSSGCNFYKAPDGKIWHPRMIKKKGWTKVYGEKRGVWRPDQCDPVYHLGKYRYLMPLDKKMRKQILPLSKPYPKRMPSEGQQIPSVDGGSTPTHPLQ